MERKKAQQNLAAFRLKVTCAVTYEIKKEYEEKLYTQILNDTLHGKNNVTFQISIPELHEKFGEEFKDLHSLGLIRDEIYEHLKYQLMIHDYKHLHDDVEDSLFIKVD